MQLLLHSEHGQHNIHVHFISHCDANLRAVSGELVHIKKLTSPQTVEQSRRPGEQFVDGSSVRVSL